MMIKLRYTATEKAILKDSPRAQMEEDNSAYPNATQALAFLRKVLTDIGWEPKPEPNVAGFYIDFGLPPIPASDAFAAIIPDTQQFVFYVNIGPAAAPDRRQEVVQFMTLVNWGLLIGNFEVDVNNGHIRFKSSVDFRGAELSENLIRNAILAAMNAIDAYSPALFKVLDGKSARQALEEIHQKPN